MYKEKIKKIMDFYTQEHKEIINKINKVDLIEEIAHGMFLKYEKESQIKMAEDVMRYYLFPLETLFFDWEWEIKLYVRDYGRSFDVVFEKINEDSFNKELFKAYINYDDEYFEKRGKNERVQNSVHLNYYTTTCDTEFELKRIEALGILAQCVRQRGEEIKLFVKRELEKMEKDPRYVQLLKRRNNLITLKRNLMDQERKMFLDFWISNPIKFKPNDYGQYPNNIYYNDSNRFYGIKELKVIKENPKSYKVEYTNSYDEVETVNMKKKEFNLMLSQYIKTEKVYV